MYNIKYGIGCYSIEESISLQWQDSLYYYSNYLMHAGRDAFDKTIVFI